MRFTKNIKKEGIEDIPTKNDIRKALTHANIKYQSIILLMVSSGMRSSDIRALKYGDFLISLQDYIKLPKTGFIPIDVLIKMLEENEIENIIPTWKVTAIKTNTPFVTFSTPESLEILLEFLKTEPPENSDKPLFPSQRLHKQALSPRGFIEYFQQLNKKCEFGRPNRQDKFRSHALRKYFATTLAKKGVQQLTIDWLLAHSIDKITDAILNLI